MSAICDNNAPYVCIPPKGGKAGILMQLACNDWTCKRCGVFRAKHEYGRIVEGARQLAKSHTLYFITVTCKPEMLRYSELRYLERTNRLLAAFRYHVAQAGQHWAYASVTERQPQTGRPHSHYLMTCAPEDSYYSEQFYELYRHDVRALNKQIPYRQRYTPARKDKLTIYDMYSGWLAKNAVKAGLGVQCRVSIVDKVEAASRYVSKYLFKESLLTVWPKKWRRVRYSQNWPKLPLKQSADAFVVLTVMDWLRVQEIATEIECHERHVFDRAIMYQCSNVILSEKSETIRDEKRAHEER